MKKNIHRVLSVLVILATLVVWQSCKPKAPGTVTMGDAASKAYVAPGKYDEFYNVVSGGFNAQMSIYGLPSGRLFRIIPVFSQFPENGWGYSEETKPMLNASHGFGSAPAQPEPMTMRRTSGSAVALVGDAVIAVWAEERRLRIRRAPSVKKLTYWDGSQPLVAPENFPAGARLIGLSARPEGAVVAWTTDGKTLSAVATHDDGKSWGPP